MLTPLRLAMLNGSGMDFASTIGPSKLRLVMALIKSMASSLRDLDALTAIHTRESSVPLTAAWAWARIDAIAANEGLSPSGLAKRAGLDPTTFNRSKRIRPNGSPRWPRLDSIARILIAVDMSLTEFAAWRPPAEF